MHTHTSSGHMRLLAVSLTALILWAAGALAAATHPLLAEEPAPIRNTVPIAQLQGDALQIADFSSTTGVAPVLPSGQTYVYEESFDTYTHRDLIRTTADWDVFSGELTGAQHKTLWWQFSPAAALANDGYVYIVWEDERNDDGDVYMQKYDLSGNRQWGVDRRINSDAGLAGQMRPSIAAGADEFLYVVWIDHRGDDEAWKVVAQKVDRHGQQAWATDVTVGGGQTPGIRDVKASQDSAGNLYIAWFSITSSWDSSGDVFAQKLGPAGNHLWSADVKVNTVANSAKWSLSNGSTLGIITDRSGSTYIAWHDGRHGGRDVYAQKLDPTGYRQWSADLPVSVSARGERRGLAIAPGTGGTFFVAWSDTRDDSGDIYLQKFNGAGNRLWDAELRINTDTSQQDQSSPTLASWQGRLLLAWTDHRSGLYYLYAQMLDESGERLWPTERGISTAGAYNVVPYH